MRKAKEILRLRFELGRRQIARSCGIGLGTVHNYLERAATVGISWPLPEGCGEEELEARLFGNPQAVGARALPPRPQPDWKAIHEQLQQHRHLTLQLVWKEYRQGNPDGYRYSWFCERYQQWRQRLDVVLRPEHKAGEKMFVDWAGTTIPVYDARTGQAWPASLFVSVLGASSYTYAEATRDQQLEAWIHAHIQALECFSGAPTWTVPDNTKTAVTRACRYDPDLNPTYQAITQKEQRPKSHQAHLEWPPSRMLNWARSIDPNTAQLFERILNAKPHPEMGYRSCLGIIRLSNQYSVQRVEAAAERALLAKACRYQSVKSILKNSLDTVPLPSPPLPVLHL